VAIRSPEIQDGEPICSAPMTEAAASSRGGIELLADDLVDPATVARHLEAVRQVSGTALGVPSNNGGTPT
jgi:hypothetical protein